MPEPGWPGKQKLKATGKSQENLCRGGRQIECHNFWALLFCIGKSTARVLSSWLSTGTQSSPRRAAVCVEYSSTILPVRPCQGSQSANAGYTQIAFATLVEDALQFLLYFSPPCGTPAHGTGMISKELKARTQSAVAKPEAQKKHT